MPGTQGTQGEQGMQGLPEVSILNINSNEFNIKDSSARSDISDIVTAIGLNNQSISSRINDLNSRLETIEDNSDDNEQVIANALTDLDSRVGTLESNNTAEENVQSDWNQTDTTADDYIKNKPTIPTVSTTVTENDTNPVSGGAVYNKFADLIGSAPAALDTLQEIATALNNDADLAGTLTTQISGKIPKVSNPTTGNFAALASDGTLTDSGHSHSDYITSETQLSKGTTTGAGNAVTDISVNDHEITLTKGTTFLTEHQSLKTVNNETLVGTGNIVVSGLPQVSASDNGKILMVVNGAWALVSPSVLYSGNGVPNNAQGNNGDIFVQTS